MFCYQVTRKNIHEYILHSSLKQYKSFIVNPILFFYSLARSLENFNVDSGHIKILPNKIK